MSGTVAAAFVVADDLTGAADTLAPFIAVCRQAIVFPSLERFEAAIDADQLSGLHGCAIAVSTESRHLAADAAAVRVARAHRAALRLQPRLLFQKVDSALRGNPGAELAAFAGVTGAERVLMTPAFPTSRRSVRGGVLLVDGVPIDHTSDGADVRTPVVSASVPAILAAQTSVGVTAVSGLLAAAVRLPEGIIVVDAAGDGDLDHIAGFVLANGLERAVSGSAGLAAALACRLPPVERRQPRAARRGGVLVVCGSPHVTMAAQLATAAARLGVGVQRLNCHEPESPSADQFPALRDDLHRAGVALVAAPAWERNTARSMTDPVAVVSRLAGASRLLLVELQIGAIVLSGGDTAAAVCAALKADFIELERLIFPGAPLGHVVGGVADGVAVVTKSGAHGDRDGLLSIIDALRGVDSREGDRSL